MAATTVRIGNATPRPLKVVSELVRERETFKYEPFLFADFRVNPSGQPLPSSELSTSADSALTALAMLGLYQTGAHRSLVSLFDSNYQYIVAEAVPSMPLTPSCPSVDFAVPLAHCGTAIPRNHGTCEHVLYAVADSDPGQCNGPVDPLPLTLVPDLTADDRFSSKPYCQFGDSGQFFAAVPIRTHMGINIGVYCVMSTKQPAKWDENSVHLMRDISQAVMKHLEANRTSLSHRRNERMNRGLGSFIEGKSTISGWQSGPSLAAFVDTDKSEGALDPTQQRLEHLEQERRRAELEYDMDDVPVPTDGKPTDGPGITTPEPRNIHSSHMNENSSNWICSKAANIIREAFEVEGCMFVEASHDSYKAPAAPNPLAEALTDDASGPFSTASSSDEQTQIPSEEAVDTSCDLLGFSTTGASSINGAELTGSYGSIPKTLVAKLLRRYPRGKIFNFDTVGELLSSDSSSDDDSPVLVNNAQGSKDTNNTAPPGGTRRKSAVDKSSRTKEGAQIRQVFPDARSVAFMPLWDSRKERWLAGSFIYTLYPTRVFTIEGELSLLKAFAGLVASDILTFKTLQADKAKSDALGSLSHELRSPLHGVILGTELLNDTDLNVFQSNATHTIETCCRTLLDTVDHLLDYSKVNSFAAERKQEAILSSPKLRKRARVRHFGKKQLSANVRLDILIEEVTESLFAGFNFQHMSIRQLSKGDKRTHGDVRAHSQLDFAQAMEQLGPRLNREGERNLHFGDVSVYLSIDPTRNWIFNVQAGAIRRIVMNLVGNSLKYTTEGTIRVSLNQETSGEGARRERLVRLTVKDTGRGIGEDYLRYKLFKPFAQEDELSPGTGLGLSLVKKITTQLRGQISVQSQVGVGTTVTVTLPLEQPPQIPGVPYDMPADDKIFEEQLRELRGLRVRLSGFESQESGGAGVDGRAIVEDICSRWLHMDIISDQQPEVTSPDIILWSHDALPKSLKQIAQLAKTPNVVLCQNALVAYQQFSSYESIGQGGVFEFVSQPIGPNKIARSILHAYKSWMGLLKLLSSPRRQMLNRSSSSHTGQLPTVSTTRENIALTAIDLAYRTQASSVGVKDSLSVQIESAELPSTDAPPSPKPQTQPPARKILLVDDNYINLKVLSAYMRKLGQDYTTVTNGREAVDAYTRNPEQFTAILMDISMPVMDGLEATRHIRAYEGRKQLPAVAILALTGLASDSAHQEALESGVDVFLTKPVRLKDLSELMESRDILSTSRAGGELMT